MKLDESRIQYCRPVFAFFHRSKTSLGSWVFPSSVPIRRYRSGKTMKWYASHSYNSELSSLINKQAPKLSFLPNRSRLWKEWFSSGIWSSHDDWEESKRQSWIVYFTCHATEMTETMKRLVMRVRIGGGVRRKALDLDTWIMLCSHYRYDCEDQPPPSGVLIVIGLMGRLGNDMIWSSSSSASTGRRVLKLVAYVVATSSTTCFHCLCGRLLRCHVCTQKNYPLAS